MEANLGTGPNRTNTFHILSNFEIEVNGDSATATSRWTFVVPGPDGRPQKGKWRFKRRTASNNLPAPGQ
jgi:hypothetical protein